MAKRRKLTAPDAEALREIDEGFAAKSLQSKSSMPPIAQVAGESAALASMEVVANRADMARDKADAGKFRQAERAGLVAQMIPVGSIDINYIHRDRVHEDPEEMDELRNSIRSSGLRAPIEVVPLAEGFGLISGFRRLKAYRSLLQTEMRFADIPAFVRIGEDSRDSYLRMVEENEVRANLTPYERGRLAVLVAGQGVFSSVDVAVNALFAAASPSKRSKVRSFAVVHEAIGDLLRFPTSLSERNGLMLASALKDHGLAAFRDALSRVECRDAAEEWATLAGVLRSLEQTEVPDDVPLRTGRPKDLQRKSAVSLGQGGKLTSVLSSSGGKFEVKGRFIDDETAEIINAAIVEILG